MRNPTQAQLPAWGPERKLVWFTKQRVQRFYAEDVLQPLQDLQRRRGSALTIEPYGALTLDPERFLLYAVRVGACRGEKKTVLVTGGVHGYETSGVKGALLFLEKHVGGYAEWFDFVVVPCVSPWSYETVNRLNPVMENPNREFKSESKAEESRLLMSYFANSSFEFDLHIDLHETTDSD